MNYDTWKCAAPDTDEEPASVEEQRRAAAAAATEAHDEALTLRVAAGAFTLSLCLSEAASHQEDVNRTGEDTYWHWPVGVTYRGKHGGMSYLATSLCVQDMLLAVVPEWMPDAIADALVDSLYAAAVNARTRLGEYKDAARSASHVNEAWCAIDRCNEMADARRVQS